MGGRNVSQSTASEHWVAYSWPSSISTFTWRLWCVNRTDAHWLNAMGDACQSQSAYGEINGGGEGAMSCHLKRLRGIWFCALFDPIRNIKMEIVTRWRADTHTDKTKWPVQAMECVGMEMILTNRFRDARTKIVTQSNVGKTKKHQTKCILFDGRWFVSTVGVDAFRSHRGGNLQKKKINRYKKRAKISPWKKTK